MYEEELLNRDRSSLFASLQVTCQDEEGSQCIPRKTFMALLRLPEVSSNLAAYSRTARIIQEAKNHNDMAHLKALSSEENEDAEICIPGGVYLELFRNPALRGHLSAMARTHKLPEFPGRLLDEEADSRDLIPESEKRSLATLAKNDDLPITLQVREGNSDDEEKRSASSRCVFFTDFNKYYIYFNSILIIKIINKNAPFSNHIIICSLTFYH